MLKKLHSEAMDTSSDKLSIKNLLFTKALPNYVIPIPINGHKVFTCTDCGDKFIFESSFNDHVKRKSVKISYMCRHCNQPRVFYNRCNLLFHIRSHVFKTATINVTDLKVEPLPLSEYKIHPQAIMNKDPKPTEPAETPPPNERSLSTESSSQKQATTSSAVFCFECKIDITQTSKAYIDRVTHFMKFTNQVYSCPICLFALPSICALKAHLRLHLKCPPYYCPECGVHLSNKNINYPYNHDCEGFKMMRATARLNCAVPNCSLFHPNDYKDHMKEFHMKKVFKCPYCVVACFNEVTMQKHLKGHETDAKALVFYQCEMCPGKFVLQSHMENHLKGHVTTTAFPCWPCGATFKDVSALLYHNIRQHSTVDIITAALINLMKEYESLTNKPKRIYRVVKRCDQCQRSFTYKCKYEEIHSLPNECPFKCTSTMELDVMPDANMITCNLCKSKISQDWKEIKKHYAQVHKKYKCLDAEIKLNKIDIRKYISQHKSSSSKAGDKTANKKTFKRKKTRFQQYKSTTTATSTAKMLEEFMYVCNICGTNYVNKLTLKKHMIAHRDPCMAYQCMECGQSFVVKPTFAKHLLLNHAISDAEDYIKTHDCYNENALIKYQSSVIGSNEPVRENQCKICREQFNGPEELEKHFRVHGMAFLMKNNSNKVQNAS